MSKKECMSEEKSEKGETEKNSYALAPTINSAYQLIEET